MRFYVDWELQMGTWLRLEGCEIFPIHVFATAMLHMHVDFMILKDIMQHRGRSTTKISSLRRRMNPLGKTLRRRRFHWDLYKRFQDVLFGADVMNNVQHRNEIGPYVDVRFGQRQCIFGKNHI